MAYEFDLEAQTDLSNGTFKIKIVSDGTVAIDITGPNPCHLDWTMDDLQRVNAANRPLIESFIRLTESLGS